jgi:nitrilase
MSRLPTEPGRLVWGFGDCSTVTVVDGAIDCFGGAMCRENYIKRLRQP